MANKGITQLQPAGPLTGTEVVPIVQNGVTKQTQVLDIASLAFEQPLTFGTGLLPGSYNGQTAQTIQLAPTSVTPNTYGDATHVAQITVNQFGQITNAVEVPISGGGGGGGTTTNPLNFTTSGVSTGATSFNGSSAITINAATLGGAYATGTNATGTWPISITGNSATATSAVTASNLAGGASGSLPYQSASGATTFVPIGTTGQVLSVSAGGVPTWTAAGGNITIANDTTTNSNLNPLFANATSGTASTIYTSSPKYKYNPSTGELTAPVFIATNGIFVNAQNVSQNYTIQSGFNGISAGPITVDSGVVVTVVDGSWSVVPPNSGGNLPTPYGVSGDVLVSTGASTTPAWATINGGTF